jgi:hypothetical protein
MTTGITLEVGGAEHNATFTASKIPAVLGVAPPNWETSKSIWMKMAYPECFESKPSNRQQRRGKTLEAGLMDLWFVDNPEWERFGGEQTFARTDLDFPAAATPDDDATHQETGEQVGIENKVVSRDDKKLWGKPGTDQIPVYYFFQTMWQMHMSGRRRTLVIKNGPYIDQQDTYIVHYQPDIAQVIEDKVRAFHQSVLDKIEPPNDGSETTLRAVQRVYSTIEADEWEVSLDKGIALEEARLATKTIKGELIKAQADILGDVGTAKVIKCGGQVIGSRRATKAGASLYPPKVDVDLEALYALRDNQAAA